MVPQLFSLTLLFCPCLVGNVVSAILNDISFFVATYSLLKTCQSTCFIVVLCKDIAEDALETYVATVARPKNKSALHAFDHAKELRNIGKELECIKQEVQTLTGQVNIGVQVMQADKGPQKKDKKI
ncbi:hypothetical protein M9H77_09559 [Catharanthus roseus]|uniref:Uncharacterized protein n=1 Tax=Catharanthus roseus TaxID=4058 RepID=A0ACC0C153_CATRO|nr:hypothetical protein M9H77_09559 [Catharanthus roseus]